ncbi:MAG TPA: glycosyltransferase [Chitinophagaceae bacterium]|jgi:glycosyltransferase involved in cell wall biosynthesis|nr:glycosyltransferase [Chitinophagaceae bacterium]
MSNEPTLVILIPGFPEDKNDSTCLPAQQNLILHINQQFPSVKLLILAFQYPFQKKEYYWNGNKVIAFGGKNKGAFARRFLWYRVSKKLNKLKKENNITGVLSFWAGECGLIGKKWADKNGVKHYCWLMGQDAKKENNYIRKSGFKGNELIAISDFIQEEVSKHHGLVPVHTIPLGVSAQPVSTAKRNIDIICAGSLIPLKQYHIAIEAGLEFKKEFPHFRMMICGRGPEKERLAGLINAHGLTENILLAGEKEHEELLSLMRQSKLLLHTSSFEGLGLVCLEALAAGTPVISFTQPMKQTICNWHIVDSPGAMIKKASFLLRAEQGHEPACSFTMKDTAKELMRLFGSGSTR